MSLVSFWHVKNLWAYCICVVAMKGYLFCLPVNPLLQLLCKRLAHSLLLDNFTRQELTKSLHL